MTEALPAMTPLQRKVLLVAAKARRAGYGCVPEAYLDEGARAEVAAMFTHGWLRWADHEAFTITPAGRAALREVRADA